MERKPLKRTQMARPRKGYWTCQRTKTIDGVKIKCSRVNANKFKKCQACGGAKRPKSKPKHMAVLGEMTYEDFVEITGDEVCGICGAPPKARRLARDHCHTTGIARGVLCFRCNSAIRDYMNLEWARGFLSYMERAYGDNEG